MIADKQRPGFVKTAFIVLGVLTSVPSQAQSLDAASDKVVSRLQTAGFEIISRLQPSRFQIRRGLQWADVSVGMGSTGEGMRPVVIIKSAFLLHGPVDRKAVEWWKIGRFEPITMNIFVTDVVQFSTVCWSEDYGPELKNFFAACEDFHKKFHVQKQYSSDRTDIGRMPSDSALLPCISTRDMDLLISLWRWNYKYQPPKRKPMPTTGIQGGGRSYPCGATIEDIGFGIVPSGPSIIMIAKVEVEEGVDAEVIVKRLWPNAPDKFTGERLHQLISSQDCFFADGISYSVTRTIHLDDKTTVGKLRDDMLRFARYVKTLPTK